MTLTISGNAKRLRVLRVPVPLKDILCKKRLGDMKKFWLGVILVDEQENCVDYSSAPFTVLLALMLKYCYCQGKQGPLLLEGIACEILCSFYFLNSPYICSSPHLSSQLILSIKIKKKKYSSFPLHSVALFIPFDVLCRFCRFPADDEHLQISLCHTP
jgi:hypothetical protein